MIATMADDLLFEGGKLVWPDVPRSAFQPSKGPIYACALDWMRHGGTLTAYWLGYADAAKLIFAGVTGNGHANDVLLFPLANAWRHCFELQLKEIIWRGREMKESGSGSYPTDQHALVPLWDTALPLFLPLGPDEGRKAPEIKNVRALLQEVHDVDEKGQAFRYPTLTTGKQSLEGLPNVLDLEAFQVAMLSVYNFLETLDSMMKQAHSDMLEYDH